MKQNKWTLVVAGLFGAVLMSVINYLIIGVDHQSVDEAEAKEKPLYWVAPMDPNYRRDKPGKSPMGMDLIPFYDNTSAVDDDGPGSIRISSAVVNNLGVRTALVESKVLHTEIKTVGYVKYDEDQLLHIHPRVEGWIDKLYVKSAGDPVKKGQALYEIYSPALVNAQEEMVLALERNNKRLMRAAEDRLRALQLPKKAIETLKKNRKVQQNVAFYSPQTGVLDNLNIRQGFFVKPGTTLMSIGALNQVWVEAEIFEEQAASVIAGLPVTMTLDYLPGKLWQGRVDYVYPSLDIKTRTLKVRLRFDNDNRQLKPNMFAQVTIHTKAMGETLLIPKEAVIRTGSMDRAVLALGEGRFKSVEVKLGRTNESYAEILMGLKANDRVVTSAQFLLDSESSTTSDFKRMNHVTDNSAKADGVINRVMAGHQILNISRGPIEKWNRPAATLDFLVDNAVDISVLEAGMEIEFQFSITDGDFIIGEIFPSNKTRQPK